MAPPLPPKKADLDQIEETDAMLGIEDDLSNDAASDSADDNLPPSTGEPEQRRPAREVAPLSPGDAKRNAIIDRFRRTDGGVFDGDMTKPENLYGQVAAEQDLEPDPDADEPGVSRRDQQQDEPAPAPSPKRKLLVRGQVVEMTDEEVLAAAQKTLAGDSYLDDARRILDEAKTIRAERRGLDPQHPEGDDEPHGNEPDRESQPDREARTHGPDLKALVEKIQFGDPDEAAKALEEYGEAIAARAETTASRVADEGHVRRLFNNDLAKSQQELAAFRDANPDLATDPLAASAIEQLVYGKYREDIVGLGVDESQIPTDPKELANWHRFYRINGYEVSKTSDILSKAKDTFLNWRQGGNPTTQQAQQSKGSPRVAVNVDRTERRQAIPQQPTRAVAPRRDAAQPPTVEQSRKNAVSEMRKSRGQIVS